MTFDKAKSIIFTVMTVTIVEQQLSRRRPPEISDDLSIEILPSKLTEY